MAEGVETACLHYELQASMLSEHSRKRKPSEARAVVAWLIQRYGTESLTDVAKHFGRDVATMSIAVRRLEERMIKSDEFAKVIRQIEKELIKI